MRASVTDSVPMEGTRATDDGYLVTEAAVARTGVQLYAGSEMGMDAPVVRVYRPGDEVFAAESLRTYSHAPVTIGHPERPVTGATWRDVAVGEASTDAVTTERHIRLPLILKDASAIDAVKAGTRELSVGYTCRIDFEDGTTPDGDAYDAIQRDIRVNHIAIVPKGRAGHECRIGDAHPWASGPSTKGNDTMSTPALKTVVVGDEAVETTDAGARAIEALKVQVADRDKRLSDMEKRNEDDAKKRKKEMDAKDGEIAALKAKAEDTATLDAALTDRLAAIDEAKAVIGGDFAWQGKTTDAIRGEAVAGMRKVLSDAQGDAFVKDRSDDFVRGAYGASVKDTASPVTQALSDAARKSATATDNGYGEYVQRLGDAWNAEAVN